MSLEGHLDVTVAARQAAFRFTVENGGTEPVELSFRSGKVADIAVYEDGTEVWRWSDGRMFTQALETQTLAPGESFVHEAAWQNPPPGEYTAKATLDTTNASLDEQTTFDLR